MPVNRNSLAIDSRGRDNKTTGDATPPPSRHINNADNRHDAAKQPAQDSAPKAARHQSSTPQTDSGSRSRIADVERRSDNKKDDGNAGSSPSGRDHRGDNIRQPANATTIMKKSLPPPQAGERTKAADVRRHLNGHGPGGPAETFGKGGHGDSPLGDRPPKPGQPKVIPAPGHGGAMAGDIEKMRFADQLKAGDLNRLTGGETAKKFDLPISIACISRATWRSAHGLGAARPAARRPRPRRSPSASSRVLSRRGQPGLHEALREVSTTGDRRSSPACAGIRSGIRGSSGRGITTAIRTGIRGRSGAGR